MSNPFEICRHNLGVAPRRFGRKESRELLLKTPAWVTNTPLQVVAEAQELLLQRGHIVPAALLRTNDQLWEPGRGDDIALALWTSDARLETDLDHLQSLASDLCYYFTNGFPYEFDRIAEVLSQRKVHLFNESLPTNGGIDGALFFLSDLLIWRDHLPCRFFNSNIVPLLVLPEETNAAIILPGQFWADELKDR